MQTNGLLLSENLGLSSENCCRWHQKNNGGRPAGPVPRQKSCVKRMCACSRDFDSLMVVSLIAPTVC
jgi:hypothetical protein